MRSSAPELGGQTKVGFDYSVVTDLGSETSRHDYLGSTLSVFGQYRKTFAKSAGSGAGFGLGNKKTFIGVHLELAGHATEWEEFRLNSRGSNVFGTVEVDEKYSVDLLGVFGVHGEAVNPFVMLGYTALKVEARQFADVGGLPLTYRDGDETLAGWKLAAGFDVPLGQRWFGQMMLQFADYGENRILVHGFGSATTNISFDTDVRKIGVRFGIGRTF